MLSDKQLHHLIDKDTWKRLTHSQRVALEALADGPAVASHPTRNGRYWTLYSLPIGRVAIDRLASQHLVTITSVPAGNRSIDSATITNLGRSVLAAGKGRGK
jgi:hypothetical protein